MAKKPRRYTMWALFNYDRPPIYVTPTRRECINEGVRWIGDGVEFNRHRREGSITIEKVVVRRVR